MPWTVAAYATHWPKTRLRWCVRRTVIDPVPDARARRPRTEYTCVPQPGACEINDTVPPVNVPRTDRRAPVAREVTSRNEPLLIVARPCWMRVWRTTAVHAVRELPVPAKVPTVGVAPTSTP